MEFSTDKKSHIYASFDHLNRLQIETDREKILESHTKIRINVAAKQPSKTIRQTNDETNVKAKRK